MKPLQEIEEAKRNAEDKLLLNNADVCGIIDEFSEQTGCCVSSILFDFTDIFEIGKITHSVLTGVSLRLNNHL